MPLKTSKLNESYIYVKPEDLKNTNPTMFWLKNWNKTNKTKFIGKQSD